MMAQTILVTTNYRLFLQSPENRSYDPIKHRRLRESLQRYGYLKSFPIVCIKRGQFLEVQDGQHRLRLSEDLKLPVAYTIEEVEFDVATLNSTPKTWMPVDFAQMHAARGVEDYVEGLALAATYKLPISQAFALLGGTVSLGNLQPGFSAGTFKVTDRAWANTVGAIYLRLITLRPQMKNARLLEACMAVCRVPEFQGERLIQGAERCRDKLAPYSTRAAYLEMLEEIYNFGRKNLVSLRLLSIEEMRRRSPIVGRDAATA